MLIAQVFKEVQNHPSRLEKEQILRIVNAVIKSSAKFCSHARHADFTSKALNYHFLKSFPFKQRPILFFGFYYNKADDMHLINYEDYIKADS